MLTPRACFAKFREAWWTIAPRGPMQSGGRDRTSPPLWNFLEASKILTPRACFEKFREAWLIIAPRGPVQSGARAPLWNFSGGRKNPGPHVLWKMSGSMVDHCPPRAYAKRGAIFLEASKMLTPRACFGKFREAWWTIAPRGPMQSGGRGRTSPPLWNFFGGRQNTSALPTESQPTVQEIFVTFLPSPKLNNFVAAQRP